MNNFQADPRAVSAGLMLPPSGPNGEPLFTDAGLFAMVGDGGGELGAQLGDDDQTVAFAQVVFLDGLAEVVFNFPHWGQLNHCTFSKTFNALLNFVVA